MNATAQRQRVNSRGRLIDSNYGVDQPRPAIAMCMGCGREFNAYQMRRSAGYAACRDQGRLYAANLARATAHADRCTGWTPDHSGNPGPLRQLPVTWYTHHPVSNAAKCFDWPRGCGEYARRMPGGDAVLRHREGCPNAD